MTHRLTHLVGAALLVAALLPVTATPALAECSPRASASTPYDITVAFIATVRDVLLDPDERVLAAGEGDGSAWTLTLDVERAYRGDVDGGDILTWTGHTLLHLSCQRDLLGGALEPGDRLFIALEPFGGGSGVAGGAGRMLVWERADGAWSFADELLQDEAYGGEPYPAAARDVHTTAEILALIDRLPDTATGPADAVPGATDDTGWRLGTQAGLLLVFALSLLRLAGVFDVRAAARNRRG